MIKIPIPNKKEIKSRYCKNAFSVKEDGTYTALIATTHPDRVGDILSTDALGQMRDYINDSSKVGSQDGAYRSISLFHDWVVEQDPTLDEAGFIKDGARMVELEDGHYGVEVDIEVNKYYEGTHEGSKYDAQRVTYEIEKGRIGGLSIEYMTDDDHSHNVDYNGETYRFIDELTDFAGVGFARSRMIANPAAVIYKEIASKAKEDVNMTQEEIKTDAAQVKEEIQEAKNEAVEKTNVSTDAVVDAATDVKETDNNTDKKDSKSNPKSNSKSKEDEDEEEDKDKKPKIKETITVKEVIESKEFKDAISSISRDSVKPKVMQATKEEKTMNKLQISVKEMNESLKSNSVDKIVSYQDAATTFLKEKGFDEAFMTTGVDFTAGLAHNNNSIRVKARGNKLVLVGSFETKDILDNNSNPSTYIQQSAEYNDVFRPGLVETFNTQTNLFGAMPKRDNLPGTANYGWRIITTQKSGLSVDVNDPTIAKQFAGKLKLQTPIKEYRQGIEAIDFIIFHSRASIGDLMAIESQKAMSDVMKDLNKDLFTEQNDSTTKVLGLEAVADSVGNPTLYGLTRTVANRLAPDTATDTYVAVGGAITTALMRSATTKVEVEGAMRGDLRYVVNPLQRDRLFELQDAKQQLFTNPDFGFEGGIRFDGVPILVDSDTQTDAVFVVDFASYYAVISRGPEMVGLAKVAAAESAFVRVNLAVVYEQPRRIHMLDTLTV